MPETPATVGAEKPWWTSKTIIGSIVAVLATVGGFFNVSLGPEVQSQIVEVLATLGAVAGSIIAIIGRFTASAGLK